MWYVHGSTAAFGGQKRASDPLRLEFKVVVSRLVGAENQTSDPWKTARALTAGPSLQPDHLLKGLVFLCCWGLNQDLVRSLQVLYHRVKPRSPCYLVL